MYDSGKKLLAHNRNIRLRKHRHAGLEYVNEVHEVEYPAVYTICLRWGVAAAVGPCREVL